jgi:predicted HNH restriction endonuclease
MYYTRDYPSQPALALPMLLCISEMGGQIVFSYQGALLESKLANLFHLTSDQRQRTDDACNAQGKRVWRNHIQYARAKMMNRGLLDRTIPDVWRISSNGYEALSKSEFVNLKAPQTSVSTRNGITVDIATDKEESAFPEGKAKYKLHRTLERDNRIVELAKQRRLSQTGRLECDVCKFDFVRKYGTVGEGFIEAHHTVPVSELKGVCKTRISDLAMVCSNCHRMLHLRRPWLRLDELRQLVKITKRK